MKNLGATIRLDKREKRNCRVNDVPIVVLQATEKCRLPSSKGNFIDVTSAN